MMASAEAIVFDVGHGNCAIIRDDALVTLIDAARGNTVVRALQRLGITAIDRILISHADNDHVGGLLTLLLDRRIHIRDIYVNSDAEKGRAWRMLRSALADARRRDPQLQIHVGLTMDMSFQGATSRIEVLAPSPEVAMGGVGSTDLHGRRITANSMSAVLLLSIDNVSAALFCADIDDAGLRNLFEEVPQPRAPVVVFPHHGGLPGRADPEAFARDLCNAVQPRIVIFSLGRGVHDNPHPAIIRGVRQAVPGAHIACTQLSTHCSASVPAVAVSHLLDAPAKGLLRNACCAGTLSIRVEKGVVLVGPDLRSHATFVTRNAPTALCRATA